MWKYIIARPSIPTIWFIQKGINLTQKEVTILEKTRFSFNYNHVRNLFGSRSSSPSNLHVLTMNAHNIAWPIDASCWPTTCGGKKVRQPFHLQITHQHTNNQEASILLTQCTIFPLVDVPSHGYGWIYSIFFLTTKDTKWLLEISLDVHVFILWKCW
jgi:hypothetical protein